MTTQNDGARMTRECTDLLSDARQFADEIDMISFTAPDEETVKIKLGTIRKAASFLRLVIEDAVENAAQAKAAHDCVVAADRIIKKLEGRSK